MGRGTPSYEAFRTYANYLRGWRLAMAQFKAQNPTLRPHQKPQVRLDGDRRAELAASLHRSWGNLRALEILNTEQMARDILFVYPPIAYYAVYHACRGFLLARNQNTSDNHQKVLRQMSEHCVGERLPRPWSAYAEGNRLVRNLDVSEWPHNLGTVTSDRAVGFVALSLISTRRDAIERVLDEKRGQKARLPNGARREAEQNHRPITIFDFFYRYRRIAHYGRADDFMQFEAEHEAVQFGADLLRITDVLTKALEVEIQAKIGSDALRAILEAYAAQHQIDVGEGPVGRRLAELESPS